MGFESELAGLDAPLVSMLTFRHAGLLDSQWNGEQHCGDVALGKLKLGSGFRPTLCLNGAMLGHGKEGLIEFRAPGIGSSRSKVQDGGSGHRAYLQDLQCQNLPQNQL